MLTLCTTVTHKSSYFQLQLAFISSQRNTFLVYAVINYMLLLTTHKLKLSTVDKVG